jgi:PAS domain S-box-containing protein
LHAGRIVAWEWDFETGRLTWSDNAIEVLGWSSDLARDFDERVHPDDQGRHQAALQRTISESVPYDVEIRFIRPDGTVIWIKDAGEVLTDKEGHRILSGVTIDITARKQMEDRLGASEERFRALATASVAIVWHADPDGSIIDGTGWTDFTGQFRSNALLQGWRETVHPDDHEQVIAKWQAAVSSGQLYENEYRLRRADGVYRWMYSRGVPIKNPDGSIREWVGTIVDVHEQKLAREELARSEERYRLLAENALDIIAQVDLHGVRRYVSPASYEVLGYEPEELVGHRVADFVHPEDRERLTAATCQLKSRPVPQLTQTYRHRHKDGRWVWLESRRRAIRNSEGNPIEFVSVMRDVTERRQMEEQLRQAQKMEAVGQLTGGIAHDFNNLLMVILGNAEMLAEQLPDPYFRSVAQMVLEGAERGAQLTQHLLAFGRRQSLNPQRLNLDEVVQGIRRLLERTIGEHIELKTEVSHSPLSALADRGLLESAILNLVVNARDAMLQGGTLTIRTGETVAGPSDGQLLAGRDVVFVTVADTGTGMSPQVLERAFEPFFTTKRWATAQDWDCRWSMGLPSSPAGT